MINILVLPDIHGRDFWIEPIREIEKYKRVIFLGDYLDPYSFEDISEPRALKNFLGIIEIKKKFPDKVILLLGNHDMPYFSPTYKNFSYDWSRYSREYGDDIKNIFANNKKLFQIAYTEDGILFTHAGVLSGWLEKVFPEYLEQDYGLKDLVLALNHLPRTKEGCKKLFRVSYDRGGSDKYGSCIWADIGEMVWQAEEVKDEDMQITKIHRTKQIFGHSLQAYYGKGREIEFGPEIELDNIKMLDTRHAYLLDPDRFKIKMIQ